MKRLSANYENLSEVYRIKQREFSSQYAHLYAVRLLELRPILEIKSQEKWGPEVPLKALSELDEHGEKEAIIIGTMYKQQDMKPSILREISTEHNILPVPPRSKYISDTDELILEDEIQRIKVEGNIDKGLFVTGVVCALRGYVDEAGKFLVSDFCFAGLPNPEIRSISKTSRYVAFISGLNISGSKSSEEAGFLLPLQMMTDFLIGQLGTESTQEDVSKVVRVIIAGDSLSALTKDRSVLEKAQYLLKNTQAGTVDAIKNLDGHLVQLASGVDVDLMPGEQDPASYLLPQQPMYRCMFQKSNHYSTFHSVTNPYSCLVENRLILGTSGQNITDISRNSEESDSLTIMNRTLEWRHLAPTCPDTLGSYPYTDRDPFIIRNRPDIYFCGNQPSGKCELKSGTLLVSIPKFSETKSIILVDLSNLEFKILNFDAEMLDIK